MKAKYKTLVIAVSFLFQSMAFAQTDVSVLMVYTDDARAAVGGTANIETDIISAIDDGNLALDNSNVDIVLSIAGMREISVNENLYSNTSSLLNDLTDPNDNTFGIVHDWRDQDGADLVYLIFEGIIQNGQANAICGAGIPCNQAFESEAFATGQRALQDVAPIVIHELGHVMGLRHDRTRDCGSEAITCGSFLFPYSFGHIDPDGTTDWGTIMAGGRPFPLLDFFSNPNLDNPSTGQALGVVDRSDASQALNNVKEIIASFRGPALPSPTPSPSPSPTPLPSCVPNAIDLSGTQDYSGNSPGDATVSADGCSITLTGNEWRITDFDFDIDSDTTVSFQFSAEGDAEIQGVGFDQDTGASSDRIFRLAGSQNWGITGFTYSGNGQSQSFTIPVGDFYTGNGFGFVIANDDDASPAGNSVTVSNVVISGGIIPPTPTPTPTPSPTPSPSPLPGCAVEESFESGNGGWSNDGASTCSTGDFIVGTPTAVTNGGVTTQVGGAADGASAFFTASNSSAGVNDVDGGNCIASSPSYAVTSNSTLSLSYFFGQRDAGDDSTGDFQRIEVSTNGGATFTTLVANGDSTSNASWQTASQTVPAGADVVIRAQCSDGPNAGDLVECGIDDVSICPN